MGRQHIAELNGTKPTEGTGPAGVAPVGQHEQYERELRRALLDGSREEGAQAPRFAEFAQEFLDVYAATNNKASILSAKKSGFKHRCFFTNIVFARYRARQVRDRSLDGTIKADGSERAVQPAGRNHRRII
jgi:hypothetical protein